MAGFKTLEINIKEKEELEKEIEGLNIENTCLKGLNLEIEKEKKELEKEVKQLRERVEYLERSNNRREEIIMNLRDENVEVERLKNENTQIKANFAYWVNVYTDFKKWIYKWHDTNSDIPMMTKLLIGQMQHIETINITYDKEVKTVKETENE